MSLWQQDFEAIKKRDIEALIDAAVPEGLSIDYKRDPYGKTDEDKREALKDITSFANSSGGHLIIGLEDSGAVPISLLGVPNDQVDAIIQRLESLHRDGVEPRISGIRLRGIDLENGRAVILIRVPKSWNPPHRVRTQKWNRFFVRNSAGVHEASVEELRVLFNAGADGYERIKAFRSDRVHGVSWKDQAPIPIANNGRIFIHLMPLNSVALPNQIDLLRAREIHAQFVPIESDGYGPRFNFDGLFVKSGGSPCLGYTQIFRNGIVESVKSEVVHDWMNTQIFSASWIVKACDSICTYLDGLKSLNVAPPIVVMIALQGVSGATLGLSKQALHHITPFPKHDPLLLPEGVINDYGPHSEYKSAMRNALDALWNSAGFAQCTYFNEDGGWQPPPT